MGTKNSKQKNGHLVIKQCPRNDIEFNKNLQRLSQVSDCPCSPYCLQPHCLSNRHVHAFKKTSDLILVDLTFDKQLLFREVLYELDGRKMRSSKHLQSANLDILNVLAFQWDIAVVQVFTKESSVFYILDCSKKTLLASFEKRINKTYVWECYISCDRQFIVLKPNTLHSSCYMSQMDRGHDIEVLKVNPSRQSCERVLMLDQIQTDCALAFDPQVNTLYLAFLPCPNTNRPSVKVFHLHEYKDNVQAKSRLDWTLSAHDDDFKGKFINLQISRNGDLILLSMLGRNRGMLQSFGAPQICNYHNVIVYLLEKHSLKVVQILDYISLTGIQNFAPVISPSGSYVFYGDRMVYMQTSNVSSLSSLCRKLLTELVLPEDVCKLTLPQSIKESILLCRD